MLGFPDTALCSISMRRGMYESCSSSGTNYLERLKAQTPIKSVFLQRAKLQGNMNRGQCSCMCERFCLRFKCFRLCVLLCRSVIWGIKAASPHRFSLSRRVMRLSGAERCDSTHHEQMRQQEQLNVTQFSSNAAVTKTALFVRCF